MTGTLINTGTVLLGASIGAAVGRRFPGRVRSLLLQTIGLVTIVIGLQGAIETANVLVLLGSVVLGAVLGETLRIETAVQGLGAAVSRWMADRIPTDELQNADRDGSSISQGFVTASLIFCVGPLTILGSIQDGLTGAYETLAIKATLDGIMSAVLASTLGWGVFLAAGTVLVFQGTLTLGAGLAGELLTDEMIGEMTAVGGLLILGLGLNILQVTRISVENLLPALILAPALTALFGQRIG